MITKLLMRQFFIFTLIMMMISCKKEKKYPPVGPVPESTSVLAAKTYTQNGYTLIFLNNDPLFDTTIRGKMVSTFFIVYPQLVARFNLQAAKTVTFFMDTSYSGAAMAGGGKVTYSARYYHSNPKDIDVVTHEVMHIAQAYPPNAGPGWITEGVADYVRYKYGVDNASAGWSLPAFSSTQRYTDSYRVTARFLVWLERNVRATIADDINAAMHSGTYTPETWRQLTGKTVDELWQSYSLNPVI